LDIPKTLGRAPRARLVAVMMMVSMRPDSHLLRKVQEGEGACQLEDCPRNIQENDSRSGY
jgi:hypothetical protein